MLQDWGACYYDHYGRLFKQEPIGRTIYQAKAEARIQILEYDGVFKGCRVFASLGLSHFEGELGRVGEVVLAADDGWEFLPSVIANALFYLIETKTQLGWGIGVSGIQTVAPEFSRQFGKVALYFMQPHSFPPASEVVSCGSEIGRVIQVMTLTEDQYALFERQGAHALEEALERNGVDPFALRRVRSS